MSAQRVRLQPKSVGTPAHDMPGALPGVPRNSPPKPGDAMAMKAALQAPLNVPINPDFVPPALDDSAQFPDEVADLFAGSGSAVAPVVTASDQPAPTPINQIPAQVINAAIDPRILDNKPPATRQEYAKQQRELPTEYPDIADIFTGAAGIVPAGGIVQPYQRPVVQPPAPPPVRVVVEYELPSKGDAYKFLRDASVFIDGQMQSFEKGQVIYDINTIEALMQGNCDFIEPFQMAETFITCPSCQHQFPESLG